MPRYRLSAIQQIPVSYAVPVTLISVLFLVLPLAYWHQLYEAASLPRYFLLGIITTTALLVWVIANRTQHITWHPGFSLIMAFFGWAALSTSWSPDPGTSLIDITQLFSMIVLAFLAMQLTSRAPQFLSFLVPAILTGAALTAIIGLGQYMGYNPLELRRNGNSIPATFINPNHAALYFDYIPWLALVSVFAFERRVLRWLAAASLGLTLAFILVNTSRGSLLALFISSLVFIIALAFKPDLRLWIKSRLSARYREILLAVLIPLVTLAPLPHRQDVQIVEQWDTIILTGKVDLSTQYRYAMYLNSIPAIIDNPITGLGYGGTRVGFQPYCSSLLPVGFRNEVTVLRELHSDPLQYFVELGLPGGFLAIAIFISLLRSGWQSLSPSGPIDKPILALGFWLGLCAGSVHALVDFPLRLPTSAAMFWLFAGVLLGLNSTRHIYLTGNSLRLLRPLLSIIGVGGLIFTLFFYRAYLTANHDLYNAYINLKKDCLAAERASQHGIKTFASDFMLLTAHAKIYTFCSFTPQQKLNAMDHILSLDPSNLLARFNRADLYNMANKPHLAIPDFEKVAESLPHQPHAYAGLGDSARLQGDNIRARHYYRAALKREPGYKYVIKQLAEMNGVQEK